MFTHHTSPGGAAVPNAGADDELTAKFAIVNTLGFTGEKL
jgi:hypothetical protein